MFLNNRVHYSSFFIQNIIDQNKYLISGVIINKQEYEEHIKIKNYKTLLFLTEPIKHFNGENIAYHYSYKGIIENDRVSKVSIVGAGMVSTPGVTYRMFRALSDEEINILAISTSEIKLSVIIDEINTLKAVKKLHTIFDLD